MAKILQLEYTCDIKVTTLFLMLMSEMTMTVFENLVKITDISVLDFFFFAVYCVKREMIRKIVY